MNSKEQKRIAKIGRQWDDAVTARMEKKRARRTTTEMRVVRLERAIQQLQQARENILKAGPQAYAVRTVTEAIKETHELACTWRSRRSVERQKKRDDELMAYRERENQL